jgi:hypothetical protein
MTTRPGRPEPDRAAWKKAFKLYVQAFKEPKEGTKEIDSAIEEACWPEIAADLFGFLRHLGEMNLSACCCVLLFFAGYQIISKSGG